MTPRARKILLYGLATALVLVVAAVVAADVYVRALVPRAKTRVVKALSDRFDADVQLASLSLRLLPVPTVDGGELVIRHRGWSDPKPLISIVHFSADASIRDLLLERDIVKTLKLHGLQIDVPRHGGSLFSAGSQGSHPAQEDKTALRIKIETLIADGAVLQIEPKSAGKDPLRFDIEKLTMHSVGPGQPLQFRAVLQNPKPPGLIDTDGNFGPWQKEDPRDSVVVGRYAFSHADLSAFKGISGILASSGSYHGSLENIGIDGTTDVPNFALKRGGAPVHLVTEFHAIVDGTNGDTVLDPVNAHFLETNFVCQGGVVKEHADAGKTVVLDAVTRGARMEDILQLVLGDQKPILKGNVDFRSKIVIPHGNAEVLDKLKLNGQFKIFSAVFRSPRVEQKLETLSDRALGITKKQEAEEPPHTVASDFVGRFMLDDGIAHFSHLSFQVPGAQIKLAGDYNLRSQQVHMQGLFRMHATLADTQSGIKRWLLKPFDRFFEKDGAGFEVPLALAGSRSHPEVSIEAFHHRFAMK